MQLLTNHIGYEKKATKQAVIQASAEESVPAFVSLIDRVTGQERKQLPVTACGTVDQWHTGTYYLVDFTDVHTCGDYFLKAGDISSPAFKIEQNLLMKKTFSDVIHYFKSQRCSGKFDAKDKTAQLYGSNKTADVHGGWYDASGDVSKYLSHLSYANYLNPQQIPMVVWNMLKALEDLEASDYPLFVRTRLQDEALFGADFLVRMQDPEGFFYMTVFDKWSKDTKQREICAYATQSGHKSDAFQAGFRQGGGMAIAALARAARITDTDSDYPPSLYLSHATRGYWHLRENNLRYLDDGQENIIDFYCALMAATELYRSTKQRSFLFEARYWAEKLVRCQSSDERVANYWATDDAGSRPFYHAADAGLPAIALMQYLEVDSEIPLRETCQQVLLNALLFELKITEEETNPFGYPRQYVKPVDGEKESRFFVAHNNESGYWWQGENARLGSLATMAYMALNTNTLDTLPAGLEAFAQSSLNWILGLNPYDMCMLDGHGYNNPDYLPEIGFTNAKGGICNGITAGFENEHDIAFKPPGQKDDMLQNWRWGEQWIPHASWYLIAVAQQYKAHSHD